MLITNSDLLLDEAPDQLSTLLDILRAAAEEPEMLVSEIPASPLHVIFHFRPERVAIGLDRIAATHVPIRWRTTWHVGE